MDDAAGVARKPEDQIPAVANVVSLATRLKAKREELGISQSQAARELDVARTAYRLWELEAAKPAPDRWRLVARWLGVTMSTFLLSEGLISDDEATHTNAADDRYEEAMGETADFAGEHAVGSFFEQGRSVVAVALQKGVFTEEEADRFVAMLARIEDHS
jgi:transcriptional regulator with XRE-family HTH domain